MSAYSRNCYRRYHKRRAKHVHRKQAVHARLRVFVPGLWMAQRPNRSSMERRASFRD